MRLGNDRPLAASPTGKFALAILFLLCLRGLILVLVLVANIISVILFVLILLMLLTRAAKLRLAQALP